SRPASTGGISSSRLPPRKHRPGRRRRPHSSRRFPLEASSSAFREAMASFPSGATIVTTSDSDGRWWGFTASSFCSVSMDPPLVLTCLASTAQCFPAFAEAARWNIHVLQQRHADLAMRFATRGAAKFDGAGFQPDADGLPLLASVSIALRCSTYSKVDGG